MCKQFSHTFSFNSKTEEGCEDKKPPNLTQIVDICNGNKAKRNYDGESNVKNHADDFFWDVKTQPSYNVV